MRRPPLPARYGLALLLSGALLVSAGLPAEAGKSGPARDFTAAGQRARARAMIAEGLDSLKRRRHSSAIISFQGATEADPGSAEAFLQLGNAYYQRGFSRGTPETADRKDVQRALDAYQTALALDPESKAIAEPYLLHYGMGQCFEALGRYDQAAEALRRASLAASHNPMPPLYSAGLRFKMRDLKQSSENLHESVLRARKIRSYPALAKLVRSHPQFSGLMTVPQNRMILETYDQVESGQIREGLAKSHIEERLSMRDALASARSGAAMARIVAAQPPDPRIQQWLDEADGDFKFRKFRHALSEYQHVLKLDGTRGSLGAAERARIYQNVGVSYRMLGLAEESVAFLEKAVKEMPGSSSTYYQLALALSTAGKFMSALQALDLSLKFAHSNADLRVTLLLARTDSELEPVRDLPGFQRLLAQYSGRARASLK